MESILWLIGLAIVAGAVWYFWPKADTNKDGKVDVNDAVANVKETVDVNKDGKVNKADAEAAVTKVKTTAKRVTAKKTKK